MEPIIKVKNLGKKYNINRQNGGYISLRDILTNIGRHPFAFLKHKAKQAAGQIKKEEYWALKDINFNIEKGEVVGIIGPNGAGKSTLLKIISQITPPTEGEIKINGSVGSLLEVGTGFHPELSGRENILLNGAILGMTKKEILTKFDEIVEFSGIGKFLDTPVKYYSSGMYVRLAFSVAAHLEPDILLVDEVLAVGDAEFQKKCLGKMDTITHTEGRTILFISHNMSAIRSLCNRCILLKNGQIIKYGNTNDVINYYLNVDIASGAIIDKKRNEKPNNIVFIKRVAIENNGNPTIDIDSSQEFEIKIEYDLLENIEQSNCVFLKFRDLSNEIVLQVYDVDTNPDYYQFRSAGSYITKFTFPAYIFNQQTLLVEIGCGIPIKQNIDKNKHLYYDDVKNIALNFTNTNSFSKNFFSGVRGGPLLMRVPSEIKRIII